MKATRPVARSPGEAGDVLGPVGGGHGPAGVIRELARDLLRQQRLEVSEAGRIEVALRDHDWPTVRTYIELALGRASGAVAPAAAAPAPAASAAAATPAATAAAKDGDEAAAGLLRILLQLCDALPRLLVNDPDLADRLGPIRTLLTARPTRERLEEVEARLAAVLEQQIALQMNLQDARSSIKDMLGLLVQRLGSVGASTERFQTQVGAYQQELAGQPGPEALGRVVDGLLRDTRAVSLEIRQSQQDLADARRKVEAYEMRVRALEQELAQTSRMVQNDPLTHALNRRGLDEVFRIEVSRAVRYQVPLTVVMVDLDDFKSINDTLGHAAGDRALIHFVTTAQACLRSTELIARTGGEEFVLAFPATPVESAVEAVRRLQRELARNEFVHDGNVRTLTFSGGATTWADGENLAQTLQRADAAMYAAKRAGKNRVVIAG
jgi:diguanylate cyclase